MEKPARKRGRPPITKEYSNPLESPMAHSSMKVQKLGAQSFSRPLMKVGQVTPSPRNRRASSGSSNGSNPGNDTGVSGPGSTTKKGRYRGVLLTTPTKKGNGNNTAISSTPCSTPSSSDSFFQSASRMTLKSSPPVPTWPLTGDKGSNDAFQQFKFALTIGENGRAKIAGSSPLSSPCKEYNSNISADNVGIQEMKSDSCQNSISNCEKKRVLKLLRQMRSTAGTSANELNDNSGPSDASDASQTDKGFTTKSIGKNLEMISNSKDSSALPSKQGTRNDPNSEINSAFSVIRSPQPPSTPRTSFTVRTGFTPNAGIDQVLLDIVSTPKAGLFGGNDNRLIDFGLSSNIIALSPKGRLSSKITDSLQHHQHERQKNQDERKDQQDKHDLQRQQYVFKFSSADPLLLTDDVDGNWSEIIYSQSQASPKHQFCFNTPPSWINVGSPRAFSPQRQDSSTILVSTCPSAGAAFPAKGRLNKLQPQDYSFDLNSSPPRESPSRAGIKRASSSFNSEKFLAEPTTPKTHEVPNSGAIGCTPLIQQTMNGSLTAKCLPGLLSTANITKNQKEPSKRIPLGAEQEDARAALKRLIAER